MVLILLNIKLITLLVHYLAVDFGQTKQTVAVACTKKRTGVDDLQVQGKEGLLHASVHVPSNAG